MASRPEIKYGPTLVQGFARKHFLQKLRTKRTINVNRMEFILRSAAATHGEVACAADWLRRNAGWAQEAVDYAVRQRR
jgi:hypothetical protein